MKFYIIENKPDFAQFYEECGVDSIFVDLEQLGKEERQGHIDSVKSKHTVADVKNVGAVLKKAELLVRIDPINPNSESQINAVIEAGADAVMLPFFKTEKEVQKFIELIDARAKTVLLFETAESAARIDTILSLEGIDRAHIGLNDMSLSLSYNFMFKILPTSFMEYLVRNLKTAGIPYGIGGVAALEGGLIPGSMVLKEYFRFQSSYTILSRTFARLAYESKEVFEAEFMKLRKFHQGLDKNDEQGLVENTLKFKKLLNQI